jgi:hypothetical protein
MDATGQETSKHQGMGVPCCPELVDCEQCDVLDMRRRLLFPTSRRGPNEQLVNVEVTLHTRFTRCTKGLTLGPPIYSTTLLPGEKVRLATTDRRSRFSFDSESKLSYRSEQTSEEQYRMSALRAVMSDENSTDNGSSRNTDQGSWDFHGDASGSVGFFSASADANAHGSHNASSTADYLREHRAHASLADSMSTEATRKAHSVSVGEVSTRTHQEGESQDHFESSSREFANPNACHALTFLFYRLDKCETITFELVSIERRVLDPVAPTPLLAPPVRSVGQVASIPQEVPATATARLDVEERGLRSEALYAQAGTSQPRFAGRFTPGATVPAGTPLPAAVRQAALAEVDAALTEEGLLDKNTGAVSTAFQAEIGFQRETSLPTAGVIVKGCLDECDVCEPALARQKQLELDRLELQNKLLARQIELLDKAQEYRCCPPGHDSDDD